MMNSYYSNDGTIRAVIIGGDGNGKTIFEIYYGKYPVYETHEIKYYEWARRLHGNAPAGTPYGYIRCSRNGKRVIITV